MSSIISAVAFVPRGFPAEFPRQFELDETEYERINALSQMRLDDARADLEAEEEEQQKATGESVNDASNGEDSAVADAVEPLKSSEEIDDELKEYNLDTYDDDELENEDDAVDDASNPLFSHIQGLAYHDGGNNDPYVTLEAQQEEEMLEREEMQIYPTDNMLLAARTEDNLSHVDVYVYESEADNLYVHHDFMLPSFPLCLEWIDYRVGTSENTPGNFCAVGTFDPEIEIWDLDVVDAVYPAAVLGAPSSSSSKASSKRKTKKIQPDRHVDAVLALAANRNAHNLLVSGSADTTIKLWDLAQCSCVRSFDSHHTDKVSSLAWHPQTAPALLSGGYDHRAVLSDLRSTDAPASFTIDSDVENVAWALHRPDAFYIGADSGTVYCCDARNLAKPLWTLQAHDGPVSCMSVSPNVPGLLATGSTDKMVKLWNVGTDAPSLVVSRDLDVGRVFSCAFAPDEAVGFTLAASGSKGVARVWDASTNAGVRRAFDSRLGQTPIVKEKIVQLEEAANDDDEDDEDDDEDEEEEEEEDENVE
ncbi:WD repeat protein [Schizosaccharomyces japonicus yFS275]|uniref:WD repeat protein n=1 Tax=Schizosaccharomyces japonicus (strain yFS275 / FY16936) TaxID=402676 RepID=B6JZW4_SCHJY|nr:WD repeat protein [Schizosaccharomyces japonicus yFS275]EEB06114.1 WD repeat protein [Schizosaccharomyces japonicus yFS275]